MELLGDLFEIGVKVLVAWLLAVFLHSYTGSTESMWGPFFICLIGVVVGREMIRRKSRH